MIRDKILKKPSVIRYLDDWLVQNAKENERTSTPFYFHPSSFSIDCSRKLQFTYVESLFSEKFSGLQRKVQDKSIFTSDPKMIRILGNGHGMHDRWAKYFENAGVLVEAERKFRNKDLRFSGSIDDIISIDGEELIIELKSINMFGFQKLTAPKKEHYMQLQIYCMEENKRGFVIYENKNTQEVLEFFVEKDVNLHEEIRSTVYGIFDSIENGTLGEKTQQFTMCQQCKFMDLCYKQRIQTLDEILVENYNEKIREVLECQ